MFLHDIGIIPGGTKSSSPPSGKPAIMNLSRRGFVAGVRYWICVFEVVRTIADNLLIAPAKSRFSGPVFKCRRLTVLGGPGERFNRHGYLPLIRRQIEPPGCRR